MLNVIQLYWVIPAVYLSATIPIWGLRPCRCARRGRYFGPRHTPWWWMLTGIVVWSGHLVVAVVFVILDYNVGWLIVVGFGIFNVYVANLAYKEHGRPRRRRKPKRATGRVRVNQHGRLAVQP